jgi:predicted nucleic acid-binding protein
MALVFLDTSALVKLFIDEVGSKTVIDLARADSGHSVALLELTRVELHAAIHRRERLGDVQPGTAASSRVVLDRYLRTRYEELEITSAVLDRAYGLIERHALRAYDAMQLAGALEGTFRRPNEESLFVTADKALAGAAVEEGLRTLDPVAAG